jgi:cell division protein FtsZ
MAKTSYLPNPARIKVFGCGGGGCNAVTRMVREEIQGVEFIALNTDAQALAITEAPVRVQLGERVTRGLGAGGDHTMGQKAAEESRDDIRELVSNSEMIFVTAGMGGGTGTGSAPVVAEEAKKSGALTIAVVTKPFSFEGSHRMKTAKEGISKLLGKVDTLIIIPNDRLLELCDAKTGVDAAFKMADNVLQQGVKAISEVITVPGTINLDFADVKAVMKDAGPAWMSIGRGSGKNRAIDAAREALASPLLDVQVTGARGVLFNVVGPADLSLYEVNEAAEVIRKAVDPDANIIFGVGTNTNMGNDVHITLIATGFNVASEDGETDDELTAKLRGIKNEEELDVPSFLRRPLFSQNHAPAPEPVKSNRPPTRSTYR